MRMRELHCSRILHTSPLPMNVRRRSLRARMLALTPRWWPQARALMMNHRGVLAVVVALLLLLLGPFLMRPVDSTTPRNFDRRLVILTPHHELIRQEFGRAFTKLWKERTGETLYLDWRVFGTSELATLIKSDYANAFQQHWVNKLHKPWTTEAATAFLNPKTPADNEARAAFLASDVSIGADLFFGGGSYDFVSQAAAGTLVATDPKTGAGLKRLRVKHPEWFGPHAIPEAVSGERFHDAEMRWCGTALSSFGIMFNRDVLKRLGITEDLDEWSDLADPRLRGQVALADPTKSGSVTKAFEMILQQQMHQAVQRRQTNAPLGKQPAELEAQGVAEGWSKGIALIQRISANARYFTDAAPKVALEVAQGDAAAGMCIDFYGRATEERVRRRDGSSRIGFIAPKGGTAISVDAVGMLRGAAQPELAEAFIEFVLSDAGQSLWNHRPGSPGGPERHALRRLPIRKDFYNPAHLAHMVDATELPFEKAKAFTYRPEWTAGAFNSLRFIIRSICIDPHHELRDAWHAMSDHHQITPSDQSTRTRAEEVMHQLSSVDYGTATGELATILSNRDKTREVREARRVTAAFRDLYEKAQDIAKAAR
jgi:iron(III) transport system substrate-binding protein